MPTNNPAALAWMLVIGHEARATEADEREVEVMYHEEKLIRPGTARRGR